jgi:hypothetical protein
VEIGTEEISMAMKEKFTAEEWASIGQAPHLLSMAMTLADFSGIGGTVAEAFASAKATAMGGQSSHELIKEISAPDELKAIREPLKAQALTLDPKQSKDQLKTMALEKVKAAVEAISAKATPADADAYKQWLMSTAVEVAGASKEGTILGFGGKRYGDGEVAMLKALSEATGVPVPALDK